MATPRAKAAAARAPAVEAPAPARAAPDMGHNNPPSPMMREIARPIMPAIPGRAVALNRKGEPVQRAAAGSGVNRFYIPPHLPPPGWSWEWKRHTAVGQDDPFYLSSLMQVGWEHVMYESYPGVFAPENVKGPVLRDGLFLMERAEVLSLEAKMEERRRADEKIGTAQRQYSRLDTSGSQTAEFDHTAQQASYIRRGTPEPLPPLNPNGGPQRQPID